MWGSLGTDIINIGLVCTVTIRTCGIFSPSCEFCFWAFSSMQSVASIGQLRHMQCFCKILNTLPGVMLTILDISSFLSSNTILYIYNLISYQSYISLMEALGGFFSHLLLCPHLGCLLHCESKLLKYVSLQLSIFLLMI